MGDVKNYIGTFTYVNDITSVEFAIEFYKKLVIQGETIGSAFRYALQIIFDKYGSDHILWASYMRYGNPEFKLNIWDIKIQGSFEKQFNEIQNVSSQREIAQMGLIFN
ncbi:MAG: hypothetical protein ACTSRP_17985 [Candidatus Helarchaeota archaeon]